MSAGVGDTARTLLAAPLAVPGAVTTLGDGLWLYIRLLTLATASGHACRARSRLARDLAVNEGQIDLWLGRLVDARLVFLVAPAPYLVLKLAFWSGSDPVPDHPNAVSGPVPSNGPVKSGYSPAIALPTLSGDRGPGEGETTLRGDLRALLGSEQEVDTLLASVPGPVIERALQRVATTPDAEIKKSRLALFRFLVAKYNRHAP